MTGSMLTAARRERELTEPVLLCDDSGNLNPNAVGWSRTALVTANLRGHWPRKKRWNFWNWISPEFVLSVTVADIVTAVDEPLDATQCGGKENCHDDRRCMTHDLWARLNERMYDYLSSVSLADLIAHHSGKHVAVLHDWHAEEKNAAPKPVVLVPA